MSVPAASPIRTGGNIPAATMRLMIGIERISWQARAAFLLLI
jgi:hypothetical protein